MPREKIYLPVDEEFNLFSVTSSKDGIVIPLSNFGYDDLHVTIFFKVLSENPYQAQFNVHLTDEVRKLKLYEFKHLMDDNSKVFMEAKIAKFGADLKKLFETDLQTSSNPPQLVCNDCISEKHFKNKPMHTRELATEFFEKVKQSISNKEILNNPPCENLEHMLHYDVEKGHFYHKTANGFVHYKDWDKFLRRMDRVFMKNFGDVYAVFDTIHDEIKAILEKHKNEN